MQSKIYLAVSGCKRGFQILYSSPGLDTGELASSLCDMRKYLRVATPGIDYYGLDFINGFRVCSIYRSTIDSAGSSGGFISVALIIPDNVESNSIRPLLQRLLETYYSVHYKQQFATPVPGTIEDGAPLEALLQANMAEFLMRPLHFIPGVSNFASSPVYVANDPGNKAIDTLFAHPYNRTYLDASKIIALPASILSQPQAYNVTFNTPVKTVIPINQISDRLTGRLAPIAQHGCSMVAFTLNGVDCTKDYSSVCLLPTDRIDMRVVLPNGKTTSFSGSVKDALNGKILFQRGDNYGFNFIPYDIAITVHGFRSGIPQANILMPELITPNERIPAFINSRGEGSFRIKSPLSQASLALIGTDGSRIMINPSFVTPRSDLSLTYPIELRQLTINFPRIAKGKGIIRIGNVPFNIDLSQNPLTLLLPEGLTSPITLLIGNNKWYVDSVTGQCTPVERPKSGIPVWIWCVIAGAVVIGVVCILLFVGGDNKSTPLPPVKEKEDMKTSPNSPSSDVEEDYNINVDADGTIIENEDMEDVESSTPLSRFQRAREEADETMKREEMKKEMEKSVKKEKLKKKKKETQEFLEHLEEWTPPTDPS